LENLSKLAAVHGYVVLRLGVRIIAVVGYRSHQVDLRCAARDVRVIELKGRRSEVKLRVEIVLQRLERPVGQPPAGISKVPRVFLQGSIERRANSMSCMSAARVLGRSL